MTVGNRSSTPPSAVVVSVGDELLLGQTVDTNGAWLSRELSHLGLRVLGRRVVGDVPERISEAVRWAVGEAEVVVCTGGLGPTPDDRTRDAVAETLRVGLIPDPGLLEALEARVRARGLGGLPEGSRAMALVPEGGSVLSNPHGAAPGLVMETREGGLCILLPGIPKEMKGIFTHGVEPLLRDRYPQRLQTAVHRVIHTFGVPESILMREIQEVLPQDLHEVSLAYLPDRLGVRLRLTTRASGTEFDAARSLGRVEDMLEPILSRYRYRSESGDLAEAVGDALGSEGHTLAVAESCTGGLLSKRLTDWPGSSGYFRGGVVAYANEVKTGLLGVDGKLIEAHGVVSEEVARAMAEGVARMLETSIGIGVTGIAGPQGGSPEKPVGTVCYAVSVCGESVSRRERFPGDREAVRDRAAHAVLGMVLRLLMGREA